MAGYRRYRVSDEKKGLETGGLLKKRAKKRLRGEKKRNYFQRKAKKEEKALVFNLLYEKFMVK